MAKYIRALKTIRVIGVEDDLENYVMAGEIYKVAGTVYNAGLKKEVPFILLEGDYYYFNNEQVFAVIEGDDLVYYFLLDAVRVLQNFQITKYFKDNEKTISK